jgi:hypothetical protein
MDSRIIYLFIITALLLVAILLQRRYCIICDASSANPKPYSFARLQLLWWTFLVFAIFITIIIDTGNIPTFDSSTLMLLGIGSLTTMSARIIDISDNANFTASQNAMAATGVTPPPLSKDLPSQGFWLDILSDKTGVSIHRFQAFIFNLAFGVWFIYQSVQHLKDYAIKASGITNIDQIIPVITPNNLILLGISAGTYIALKTTENK